MRRRTASLLGLFCLWSCQAPIAPAPTAPVQAHFALGGYRTQAVLTAFSAAAIDHVRLTLQADLGAGYQATGAVVRVPRAGLGAAVSLGQLKMNRPYRVLAEAFATADEAVAPISEAGGSTTDFVTPRLQVTAGGIPTIDDAPRSLVALRLKLKDQTYAGRTTVTLAVASNFNGANRLETLSVKLFQVGAGGALSLRSTRAIAIADAGAPFPLTNLRSGTSYRLTADGLRADGTLASDPSKSLLSFTTPDVVGGQVDDAVPPLTLPVQR